ncbi:MAG: hypothetical protein JRJ19_07920 [Deltaproteobacteria bacterium]|nr:hypothetical protein [Deltaproteobacteria bacterium]MBW1871976.1 hypothetical protein [Deltaproteobacteria bacterium]
MGSRLKGKKSKEVSKFSDWRIYKLIVYAILALGIMGWMLYLYLESLEPKTKKVKVTNTSEAPNH